ncbi:MAG: sn-glycerol-1-phosphate dehydrogenase [Clostridia bacterium]|nr:sn-glycerol-1-phosphate dehydrogenase [Clostridia bacterium]
MSVKEMEKYRNYACACGKIHDFSGEVISGCGAINELPRVLKEKGIRRPFIIADENTYKAAGAQAAELCRAAGAEPTEFVFREKKLEPEERTVGLAMLHYDYAADAVIGVGSGVINDISKIVAAVADKPYIIVGTAPSMDGFASATSSLTREGLKISLPSKAAEVIIGDTDILAAAPMHMMLSGLGDMLAKYVSICEWRIANRITGEYYCPVIADLVRRALKKCVDNAEGLLSRDKAAVQAVFEGLVLSGAAMKYAGVSRPASGVEHYISHVFDMRGVEFGTPTELHGIQCAVGTLIAARLYEKLEEITPDAKKGAAYAEGFDPAAWNEELRTFFGRGAEDMIRLEQKEHKYDPAAAARRREIICGAWDEILAVIKEELPSAESLAALYDRLGIPKTVAEIGQPAEILPMTIRATKDIRDKYVLSRLAWDLGILDELAESAK